MNTTKSVILGVSCLLAGLAIGWNLTRQGVKTTDIRWKYGEAELVIDLEQDLASDETLLQKMFSRPFSAAGAEGWLREERDLYRADDPALVQQLDTVDYNAPVSTALRDLRNRRRGPWSYRTQEVNVGIPGGGNPRRGYANVCESGIFRNQTIELFLPDDPARKITVLATGRYRCPENYAFPDVQLNPADARELFGYGNFSKTERAAAIVVGE